MWLRLKAVLQSGVQWRWYSDVSENETLHCLMEVFTICKLVFHVVSETVWFYNLYRCLTPCGFWTVLFHTYVWCHVACGFWNSVVSYRYLGAGIAQWLERQTRDRKVEGSNPCWSGGRIFFSRVNFLCLLLFRYRFHPRVTAVARKRPWSFCQKHRWQVTGKHAYTLCMWLCMKWHGAWLYGVHRTRRDGSSFMWHHPCQRCKYTTLVDIQKRAIKSYSLM